MILSIGGPDSPVDKPTQFDGRQCANQSRLRRLTVTRLGEPRPGRDRAIPGSLDAHPAGAGRQAALQIALAGVPPARWNQNAPEGRGLPGLLSLRGVLAVKACARAKAPVLASRCASLDCSAAPRGSASPAIRRH